MSPGEWKTGGAGMTISYGFHPSPFGTALVLATERGLCGLAFADQSERAALRGHARPLAERAPGREQGADASLCPARIFEPGLWRADQPLRVVLIGTDFEVRVWETLLNDPARQARDLFAGRRRPSARARPRARSARRSERIRSPSWCPATA